MQIVQQQNIRGSNKRKWNITLISVFPGIRSNSRVFPAFIRFLSLCLFKVIAILPGIRKTFNLAPLNTSDIKSYSIVRAEEWERRLIILYGSLLGQKRKSGRKWSEWDQGRCIRSNGRNSSRIGRFFFRSPTRRQALVGSVKRDRPASAFDSTNSL